MNVHTVEGKGFLRTTAEKILVAALIPKTTFLATSAAARVFILVILLVIAAMQFSKNTGEYW